MRIPTTVSISRLVTTIDVTLKTIPAEFSMDTYVLVDQEQSLDTCTEVHSIEVVSHGTTHTTTDERDDVNGTSLLVTKDQVAQVEHCMTVQNPILVTNALLTWYTFNSLTPDTLSFQTETETRSKPLTNGDSYAWIRTIALEWALRDSTNTYMLLTGIPSIPVCTCLYKPIAPKRVCSNTVLLCDFILCERSY